MTLVTFMNSFGFQEILMLVFCVGISVGIFLLVKSIIVNFLKGYREQRTADKSKE